MENKKTIVSPIIKISGYEVYKDKRLNLCRYCLNEDILLVETDRSPIHNIFQSWCDYCGALGPHGYTEEEAINRHNNGVKK